MGRAIVANASLQFLLKQSPTAVDVLADVFKLTSEEKKRLSQFPVGQGLFFAGQNHVHIQVIASPTEAGLISTNPTPVIPTADPAAQPPIAAGQPYGAELGASGEPNTV
jgi:conjugal transfer ATP-binding protein TraC